MGEAAGPYFVESMGAGFAVRRPNTSVVYMIRSTRAKADEACAEANERARLDTIRAAGPDLLDALQEARAFIADHVDVVDGAYGEPAPNRAMSLLPEIDAALAKAGVTP